MSDFVSEVKTIPFPQQTVYEKLSDLTHLQRIKEMLSRPEAEDMFRKMAEEQGRADAADKFGSLSSKLDKLSFDRDTVTIGGSPIGNVTLRIINREEPKTIKFEGEGTPVATNLWIQLLPIDTYTCKMRVTLRAELNFFIRKMASKPLQEGVDGMAAMLASLPYSNL
jgi:hypothetical protein